MRLREEAHRDPLTGLLNRRGLEDGVRRRLQEAAAGGEPHVLLYLDLDGFKGINDAFGHGEGDEALRTVASVLRRTMRAGDAIARLGGDEFAVYAPAGPDAVAWRDVGLLTARIHQALAAENGRGEANGRGYVLRTSVGGTTVRAGDTLGTALARADVALYAAKSGGRARRPPRVARGGLRVVRSRTGTAASSHRRSAMRRLVAALRRARVLVLAAACAALAAPTLRAQALDGRWVHEADGQTAQLDLRHDRATGRVTGTFTLFGRTAPLVGRTQGGTLVVESLGGIATSADDGTMVGRLQGGTLMLTVVQPGEPTVTLPMVRRGAPAPASAPASAAAAPVAAHDFAGRWEATSDDGTSQEVLELEVAGGAVSGTVTVLSRGYFSGRTTVDNRLLLRGTLQGGSLRLRLWPADASPAEGADLGGFRRGDYLVLTGRGPESGYARPGTPLVREAGGVPAAAALARAVSGRVYGAAQQAAGRGALVGGRLRLAFCADGRVEYDASDLASTPDADMGGSVARRGAWDVVLLAGAPAVRARWQGTGTSYALTRYFRIRPDAAGRSADIDGRTVPVAGRC